MLESEPCVTPESVRSKQMRSCQRSWRVLARLGPLGALLMACAASCGGRAALDGGEYDDDAPGGAMMSSPNGGTTFQGTESPAGRPASEFPSRTVRCEPGFRSSGSAEGPCNYLFDGLCYENEDTACACACPGSLCVIAGRQTVDNGPLAIVCQARP